MDRVNFAALTSRMSRWHPLQKDEFPVSFHTKSCIRRLGSAAPKALGRVPQAQNFTERNFQKQKSNFFGLFFLDSKYCGELNKMLNQSLDVLSLIDDYQLSSHQKRLF